MSGLLNGLKDEMRIVVITTVMYISSLKNGKGNGMWFSKEITGHASIVAHRQRRCIIKGMRK
jgi:hypothetical protein